MSKLTFKILGCGSSGGVPRLGGNWGEIVILIIAKINAQGALF